MRISIPGFTRGDIVALIPALFRGFLQATADLEKAKANYDPANAGVNAAAANVTQAEAQVSQKDAAVTVAQTNLDYTMIRSPIDGTVVARNVDVGKRSQPHYKHPRFLPSRRTSPRCGCMRRRTSRRSATSSSERP